MAKRKLCSCALVNGHLSGCPYRNQAIDYEIDVNALAKMMEEMVEVVSKENANPPAKRKRIFVAPVIKVRRKKRKAAD